MRTFGHLTHRTAVCEGCGKRLPTEADPAIVWGHSLDGLAFAAYCESCATRFRVEVVERVECGLPATVTTPQADEPAPVNELRCEAKSDGPFLVGVLSDTHGRLDPTILDLFAGVDHIVHAGDVGDWTVLEQLSGLAPVTAVRGNCAEGNCAGLPESATAPLDGVMVHVRHDLVMVEALDASVVTAMEEAGRGVVICGHTHMPAIQRKDGVLYLNPGSATLRRYEVPRAAALLRIERQETAAEIHELGYDVLL